MKKNNVENISIKELAGLLVDNLNAIENSISIKLPEGITKTNSEFLIRTIFEIISKQVQNKKIVTTPLGRFIYKLRNPRICKNFKTGKSIEVPATGTMNFSINSLTKEIFEKIVD